MTIYLKWSPKMNMTYLWGNRTYPFGQSYHYDWEILFSTLELKSINRPHIQLLDQTEYTMKFRSYVVNTGSLLSNNLPCMQVGAVGTTSWRQPIISLTCAATSSSSSPLLICTAYWAVSK
eukprot:TRINITY_DN22687_c0_g1_i1.p1 TRINITY_DN22687_c0_g1~~TRINITY_DN22687_c0_g1_i1.p1  ORF type:complete len:120 (+),score=5.54 TRINITY_DN22687_c0_g1_i1:62-421(+)